MWKHSMNTREVVRQRFKPHRENYTRNFYRRDKSFHEDRRKERSEYFEEYDRENSSRNKVDVRRADPDRTRGSFRRDRDFTIQTGTERHHNKSGKNKEHEYIQASPGFRTTTKIVYKILRLVHHLQNVTTKVKNNQPITFKRMTDYLIDTVKPVASTDETQLLLEGNAKNWTYTTQLILEQHYESLIEESIQELKNAVTHGDWKAPFKIAKRWALRNFGQKFRSETFEQTEALITAHFTTDVAQKDGETSTLRGEEQQRPQMVTTETQTSAVPFTTKTKAQLSEMQTSQTAAKEWSFDDFPPLSSSATRPLTPKKDLAPRVQRTQKPRRLLAPCVASTPLNDIDQCPSPSSRKGEAQQMKPVERNEQQSSQTTNIHTAQIHTPDNTTPMSSIEVELSTYSDSFGDPGSPLEVATGELVTFDTDTNTSIPQKTQLPQVTQVSSEIQVVVSSRTHVQDKTPSTSGDMTSEQVLDKTPVTSVKKTQLTKPVRHISTNKKLSDWSLTIRKKYIIIGDSNVARFPTVEASDLQMDSYPGASFFHATDLLKKATITTDVEKLVLSFGINNRQQRLKQTAIKQLQRAHRQARIKFPNTEIFVPIINFSRQLPMGDIIILEELNAYIKRKLTHIPALPKEQFKLESDGIHWKPDTAKAILQHWQQHLNL
ncbi:hypothetical protein E1301_Tti022391 [Triplophysa tibetana]|uniref:Uncharacterized protein n=1 Tax=Triplophysa tibetana TaxID=1572043 RepID=A0A5A9NMV9_9TELE|nr:hypothetical protein E1301_Tti022391 [Triplophysa tibetana]